MYTTLCLSEMISTFDGDLVIIHSLVDVGDYIITLYGSAKYLRSFSFCFRFGSTQMLVQALRSVVRAANLRSE